MTHTMPRLQNRFFTKINILLLLLGLASLLLYRLGLRAHGTESIAWFIKLALGQSVIYFLAAWLVVRADKSRATVFLVIALAIAFRLAIIFSPPYLSDDIYRYIWDGRVQAAGINPYRYVPADPALSQLRDEKIYPKINRRDYAQTVYPPAAQALFFLTTRISESVAWMKFTMFGFEVLAAWAIIQLLRSLGLAQQRVLIYAWHPLVVWEFAGSGHVDAVAVAFIGLSLLAFQKRASLRTGCALAIATLTKLFPLVLFPAIYKRWGWKMPFAFALTVLLAYLPYLSVGPTGVFGFLPGYAKEENLISGDRFYAIALAERLSGTDLPTVLFFIFGLLVMSSLAIWAVLEKERVDCLLRGLVLATATTVLFAPHYSWYFVWLVPFLCFKPLISVFYLTAASFILYGTWLGDSPGEMFRLNSYIYLPFVTIAIGEITLGRRTFRWLRQDNLRIKLFGKDE